jgi:cytidylate kinase
MPEAPLIIAIDGTSASGKGTLARRLARHYRLPHLDTGLLYRAVGAAVLRAGADPDDPRVAEVFARQADPAAWPEAELRTAEVGEAASRVSRLTPVRLALLALQRDFARQSEGAILDGRDIGTVICPDAPVKFFVDARSDVRARRRWRELSLAGGQDSFDSVHAALQARDARDAGRVDAPMQAASDAHLLDTTDLDIDATVETARRIIDASRASLA